MQRRLSAQRADDLWHEHREMLRAAALGVAVANAGAAAMGAADVVVASNDAGGALAVRRWPSNAA